VDAEGIVAGWQRRLVALAENPDFVYRDTPQELIDREQARLTTFAGYPEVDVAAAEERLGVRFPAVFRQYLLEMARSPGDLFRGSDLARPHQFARFRSDALELLTAADPALALPREAVVFLFHQGYSFTYVLATGGFDGPTVQWDELGHRPARVTAGFAELVDAELESSERLNRQRRESGGRVRTIRSAGAESAVVFSESSGIEHPRT
jgi:hypothetical protein